MTLKWRTCLVLGLGCSAFLLAGCGTHKNGDLAAPRIVPVPNPARPMPSGNAAAGREMFLESCAGCHGEHAEGTAAGPSLKDSVVAQSASGVRVQILDGKGAMPSFRRLLDGIQVDDLVAYVVGVRLRAVERQGQPDILPPAASAKSSKVSGSIASADVESGAKVYAANCASCHGLLGSGAVGPRLSGRLPYAVVYRQVLDGGGVMPSFGDILDGSAIQDVSAFVASGGLVSR